MVWSHRNAAERHFHTQNLIHRHPFAPKEQQVIVTRRAPIARKYFETWFAIDFFSTAPAADRFVSDCQKAAEEEEGGGDTGALKMLRILKLIRLLKLARIFKLAKVKCKTFYDGPKCRVHYHLMRNYNPRPWLQ